MAHSDIKCIFTIFYGSRLSKLFCASTSTLKARKIESLCTFVPSIVPIAYFTVVDAAYPHKITLRSYQVDLNKNMIVFAYTTIGTYIKILTHNIDSS